MKRTISTVNCNFCNDKKRVRDTWVPDWVFKYLPSFLSELLDIFIDYKVCPQCKRKPRLQNELSCRFCLDSKVIKIDLLTGCLSKVLSKVDLKDRKDYIVVSCPKCSPKESVPGNTEELIIKELYSEEGDH